MVTLIGAAVGFLLEAGAPGARIQYFGDALWWSAALVTTIGSELYPVTSAGRVLAFVLMVYAIGILTYFIGSVAPCSWPWTPGQHQNPGKTASS